MCARFTLKATSDEIAAAFDLDAQARQALQERHNPSYNIAPTHTALLLHLHQDRLVPLWASWGLIPSWAKDERIKERTINARSETAADKASFREAFRSRRCLLPANGFFEWRRVGRSKQPMYVSSRTRDLFAMAGLWERWTSPQGTERLTFTILTTRANQDMSDVHDRMPLLLAPEQWTPWLDQRARSDDAAWGIDRSPQSGVLQRWDVDSRVNSPGFDQPLCIQPALRLL